MFLVSDGAPDICRSFPTAFVCLHCEGELTTPPVNNQIFTSNNSYTGLIAPVKKLYNDEVKDPFFRYNSGTYIVSETPHAEEI